MDGYKDDENKKPLNERMEKELNEWINKRMNG